MVAADNRFGLIHGRFEEAVRRSPGNPAVRFDGVELTYHELNERANRLAHHLRELGVGPEVRVAFCVEPSIEAVVGILGILKAGGSYVPLDPTQPHQRLGLILSDVGAELLLTASHLTARLHADGLRTVCLDDLANLAAQPAHDPDVAMVSANAAYVIYTSGSTGMPKGVVVDHANVVRLFEATDGWFGFGAEDTWSLFHSFAFDFSVWELWGALFHGGLVVVVPQATRRAPDALRRLLVTERVTVLSQTPSAFYQLMEADEEFGEGDDLALRLVVFGGEALSFERLAPWVARHGDARPRLVNMYGITETTVHVTYRPITKEDVRRVPGGALGLPIPDLRVHLLDENLRPVPAGTPAELYVAGAGIARGYLARPGLTAERFIPDPTGDVPGARLYRSGDLARVRADGELEYLGRVDDQVSVRGFRVELGEVEAALRACEGVEDVVIVSRADPAGTARLVAYVVARDARSVAPFALRRALGERLPGYMMPSAFVALDRFPLTANGKIDRRALPEPPAGRPDLPIELHAPTTRLQRILCRVWEDVLALDAVGVHDNFFDLGGDSIRSVQVAARAREHGVVVGVHQIFEYQTVAELATHLDHEAVAVPRASGIRPFDLVSERDRVRLPAGLDDAYPLAMLQAGLVYHSERSPGYQIYVSSFHVGMELDTSKLAEALRRLAARHPMLRTSFDLSHYDEALQLVHSAVELPLVVADLREHSAEEQDAFLAHWFEEEKRRAFDWTTAPLFRFHVHRRTASTFQLSMSEPLLDGWSVATAVTELLQDYAALLVGDGAPVRPPPAVTYAQFIALEREALSSSEHSRFWARKLEGCAGARVTGSLRNEASDVAVFRCDVPIPARIADGLAAVARGLAVPLKSVLIAAHLRVVALLSGRRDVVTGLVTNGRPEEGDADRVVGLFLNTVPLRQLLPGGRWSDLVRQTRGAEQALLPHRRYPLARIQRERGGQPLFDTVFNFTHFHVLEELRRIDRVEVLSEYASDQTYFPLTAQFNLDRRSGRLTLALDLDGAHFTETDARVLGGYYERALAALAEDPEGRYEQVALLSAAERRRVVQEWNDTARPYAPERCLHERVQAQVERTPDATALVWGRERWTYRELDERAEAVARRLAACGVGPEVLVGVCLARGARMVAGLLGVLKAGGACLPLDPAYPAERLRFMLEDAGAGVVITEAAYAARLAELGPEGSGSSARRLLLDDVTAATASGAGTGRPAVPANLAYVIYTSGSTGRPKGVALEHRSLAALVQWAEELYTADELAGVLASTSICFDLSLFELFVPLCRGGTVILAEDALQLAELPSRDEVTLINTVPSAMAELLRAGAIPASVRTVNLAGEPLRTQLVRPLYEWGGIERVYDLYGPTEDTTYSTVALRSAEGPETIGRPIANTRLYVLDERMQPVPAGVPGEIYLGGAGQARGYLRRARATAERFVPDPFSEVPGARLYRTGDRARHLPDGQVEFLGRRDHQVKVRGFRIELGEVEAALARHPAVRQAVVLAREDEPGRRQLVAYVVAEPDAARAGEELRGFLAASLPHFMLPARFVFLAALPLTPNGKVDRDALAPPDPAGPEPSRAYLPPRTPMESIIARIWADVLGVERVGVHDNFFDLGGDSILSIQIVAQARQHGLDLTHAQLFKHQTIGALAGVMQTATTEVEAQGPVSGALPLTPIQHWFFEQNPPDPHHWNQAVLLETSSFDTAAMERVVEHLLLHHDALRLRFHPTETGWHQIGAEPGGTAIPFHRVDLKDIARSDQSSAVEAEAAKWQTRLDITEGPLIRVVHFDLGPDRTGRLLIVCHHLAVDGVSWRILLEDLQTAFAQAVRGNEIRLPARTTSFQEWARQLERHAESAAIRAQLPYWTSEPRRHATPIPRDHGAKRGENSEASARVVSVSLTPEETDGLLHDVPAVYRTQVNDALLAGLVRALSRWTGGEAFLVDVEGHGREPMVEGIDLSRTVGWFTSIFPVPFAHDRLGGPGANLRSIKEQMRAIPDRGIGYGLLRYLCRNAEVCTVMRDQPRAELSFNYLGQFQRVLPGSSGFRVAREAAGPTHGPWGIRCHLLEVRGGVYTDHLRLDLTYSENVHRRSTIEALANAYVEELRLLLDHCRASGASGYTPLDFPLAGLDGGRLKLLLEGRRDVEDVYPLAPLQAGMLFHALYSPEATSYCMQITCTLHGALRAGAFEDAWRRVVGRHPVLRTYFPWEQEADAVQVVIRRADFTIHYEDLRDVPLAERLDRIDNYREADRAAPFELNRPPLLRLALLRTGDEHFECVFSYHHLILDGWSAYRVLGEVFACYEALASGVEPAAAPTRPYREYIAWLRTQDLAVAEAFWRDELRDLTQPPRFVRRAFRGSAAGRTLGEERLRMPAAETATLREFARRSRLTLGTVVQGAWALILQHETGADDIVFGATVTGRPTEQPDIGSMVGAFVNTLPVRVRMPPAVDLRAWLQRLQERQTERQRFEHTPLHVIHEWSGIPKTRTLFDSIVVFENFPSQFPLSGGRNGLEISDVRSAIDEDYPMVLVVDPGEELSLQLKYDRTRLDAPAAGRILRRLALTLATLVESPDTSLGRAQRLVSERHDREEHARRVDLRKANLRRLKNVRR
jgi:amino acid adenylation domain-containing protein/non-ribosomal peptide synthase protein (TIGR01720 family)